MSSGIFFAYWIGSEVHYARSISPESISSVSDFFVRFGEPRFIRMIRRDGRSYYELNGQGPSPWLFALPSAPPAYVFDEQGRFVAWCSDPGEVTSYRRTWPLESNNKIEVEVVREKFGLR